MPHRDQRRFPRVAAHATMMVESLDDQGLGEFARTSSIGAGGCGFRSNEPLDVGSEILVTISAGDEVVRTRARVAHSVATDNGYEVGVEFVELHQGDDATLRRLLSEG